MSLVSSFTAVGQKCIENAKSLDWSVASRVGRHISWLRLSSVVLTVKVTQMSESDKEAWVEFLEAFKEKRLLWDAYHPHNTNKFHRDKAFKELLEIYKKIEKDATILDMRNKITNMRTAFVRERKKLQERKGKKYVPTLWYFDLLCFLEPDTESLHFGTLKHFSSTLKMLNNRKSNQSPNDGTSLNKEDENWTPHQRTDSQSGIGTPNGSAVSTSGRPKRSSARINRSPSTIGAESEEHETPKPSPPKRRIYNLLQKQEKFIDTACSTLLENESDWQVQGKAIGLQLYKLKDNQRKIAEKIIADIIFYGSMEKLTVDSSVSIVNMNTSIENDVNMRDKEKYMGHSRDSPEIEMHEDIEYLEDLSE